MPSPEQILRGLAEIANRYWEVAVLWHLVFGSLAAALLVGARPAKRLTGGLLALPLLSVSVLAWTSGNPFNGAVFALTAVVAVAIAAKLPAEPVTVAPTWLAIAGSLLFAFGWVYPHFLLTSSPITYLYAAPSGLLPCPTLSAVIGASVVLGGLGSNTWRLLLIFAGAAYGLIGALYLGVLIDGLLLVGVGLLAVSSEKPETPRHSNGQSGAASPL